MKQSRRMCICLSEELEQKIIELRKNPEYERKSLSEVARIMMIRGMKMEECKEVKG